MEHLTDYDVEGEAASIVNSSGYVDQQQISNELRYNGSFNDLTITSGLYYFYQNMKFLQEQRTGAGSFTQGGEQKHEVAGIFSQVDWAIVPKWSVQLGGRYSYESKVVDIANLASCTFATLSCNYDYHETRSDDGFTPKIGAKYQPTDNVLIYATAQQALRSGGYSIRYSQPNLQRPSGFGPEKQDAYEIGLKSDWDSIGARFNLALFHTKIDDLQRDAVVRDPVTLLVYTDTLNTANAELQGFEAEYIQWLGAGFTFFGSVGHINAKFTEVRADLNRDGVVNGVDLALKLPRAPAWSYSAGLQYDRDFSFGNISGSFNYSYADDAFYDDQNRGYLPARNVLNANLNWSPDTRWELGVYGRNLTDELILDAATPIGPFCGCYAQKGRVIGVEASVKY